LLPPADDGEHNAADRRLIHRLYPGGAGRFEEIACYAARQLSHQAVSPYSRQASFGQGVTLRSTWGTIVAAILLAVIVTLARGYAFVKAHGSLSVYATDVSDTTHRNRVVPLAATFLDASGATLAHMSADSATGVLYITQPTEYACRAVEIGAATDAGAQRDWTRCFDRESRWLMTWIRRARFIDIDAPPCSLRRVPMQISESTDPWWLWWVPLRHIGGDPYTYFSVDIRFDRSRCTGA
jgi:hypothetical protein